MVVAVFRFCAAALLTGWWSIYCLVAGWFVGPRRAWVLARMPWGRQIFKTLGIDFVIQNPERMVRPAIYVSNHQSFLDVVLVPAIVPRETVIVSKREVRKVPLLGPAFAKGGAVFIDRSNPRGAIESIRQGISELPKDWSIAMFPEGTRSVDGELRPFKKGCVHVALATGFPIVPIAIHGVREVTRSPRWLPRPGTVHIAVGEPITTTGWSQDDVDMHVAEVREAVARELTRARNA